MVEFAAWNPPAPPAMVGRLASNRALTGAHLWRTLDGHGPEDVAVDGEGHVVAGLEDGRLLRWSRDGGGPDVIATTGGRPLGIEVDRDGSIVVCDARRGLLRVHPRAPAAIEVIVDRVAGRRMEFTNNAAIARDGTVYFSDSSTAFGIEHYRDDLAAHQPLGRVFALAPGAAEPRLLADGIHFANGVALAADESFLVVAETGMYRLLRVPLAGPPRKEVLVDNLPGFPDNLSTSPRGTFWVPLPTPRNRLLDVLLPRPRLRRWVMKFPERLQPQPKRHGLVLEVDAAGAIVRALDDPTGRVAMVTGAREHAGRLYLGSLTEPAVAVVTL